MWSDAMSFLTEIANKIELHLKLDGTRICSDRDVARGGARVIANQTQLAPCGIETIVYVG
jgi:hypothetical protein